MGGTTSKSEDPSAGPDEDASQDALKTLISQIDALAARYILSQSFADRRRLASPEYCDQVVQQMSLCMTRRTLRSFRWKLCMTCPVENGVESKKLRGIAT